MGERKSIAVDMDGVLANNKQHYLDYYYKETGIFVKEEDIQGLSELNCVPEEGAVRRYIDLPGFFRTLPVSENAQEVLQQLNEEYDVYIVSAAMEFPHSLREKYDWLAEHFPFISWHQIVFCGDKSIIHTDFLIDDHIKNLRTFRGTPLLFTAFHNVNETGYKRLSGWNDVARFFQDLDV